MELSQKDFNKTNIKPNISMKQIVKIAALALLAPITGFAQSTFGPGTITTSLTQLGSPHNFSDQSWNAPVSASGVYQSGGQICQPCHTPHNANVNVQQFAPLWNHQLSTATYTMFENFGTTVALQGLTAPDGVSQLCLSCHDGSVALGSFGGLTGSTYIGSGYTNNGLTANTGANLGFDLRGDHPISIVYDTVSTDANYVGGGFRGPHTLYSTYTSPGVYTATTKAVSTKLDVNNKIQCTSCHSPHSNSRGYQLSMNNQGSQICLICHVK